MTSKKTSPDFFALAQNRNMGYKTPSSLPYNPIYEYTRLLTRNEKIGIFILFLLVVLGVVFILHWKDIINIPFLPPSTKQHPKN